MTIITPLEWVLCIGVSPSGKAAGFGPAIPEVRILLPQPLLVFLTNSFWILLVILSRDRAVRLARWAHNPKVGGSNPPPATISSHFYNTSLHFNLISMRIYLIESYILILFDTY